MICNSCFESMLIRYYKKNAVYSNGKIDLSLHNGATLKRKAHASGAVVASYMQFSRSKSTQRCAAYGMAVPNRLRRGASVSVRA